MDSGSRPHAIRSLEQSRVVRLLLRFYARALDQTVGQISALVFMMVAYRGLDFCVGPLTFADWREHLLVILVGVYVFSSGVAAYLEFLLLRRTGWSIGKKLCCLSIVPTSGKPLTAKQWRQRCLLCWLCGLGAGLQHFLLIPALVFGIQFLVTGTTLWDRAADTDVRIVKSSTPWLIAASLLICVQVASLAFFGAFFLGLTEH